MRQLRSILTILFTLGVFPLMAQVDSVFWMAMPPMAMHSHDMTLHLYVFADAPHTHIRVSMPADGAFMPYEAELDSGTYADILLASDYTDYHSHLATPHGTISNRGLLVRTSHPVTCYYQLTGVNGEAVVPRGSIALGTDFRIAMQNRYRNSNIRGRIYRDAYSSLQVIATEDSTHVWIEPSVPYGTDGQTQPLSLTLGRGQVYSLRALSKQAGMHLTGTHVHANKPISVMTSDDSASPHQKFFGEDAILDQMLPTDCYGNDFIAIGRGLSWEGCFISAGADSAHVQMTGNDSILLIAPFRTCYVSMGKELTTLRIHSDQPVQVFQISGYWNEMGGVLLPDIHNGGSQIVHYRRMTDSRHTSVHVLVSSADTAQVRLDGHSLPATFHTLPDDSLWAYALVSLSDYPIGQTAVFTATSPFHIGVVDATLTPSASKRVITSASYSYFSLYRRPKSVQERLLPLTNSIDTLPVDSILLPDTLTFSLLPVDTVRKRVVHDTLSHRLLFYAEGGYSHNPLYVPGVHFGWGYGAGGGLLYELRNKHFLFDIGAGFLWQDTEHYLDADYTAVPNIDTQHADHTLYYLQQRSDRSRIGYAELPLLIGGEWDAFYFLAGVKVGVPLFGNTRMTNRVSTWAMYDEYFVPFSEMDVHGLRFDVPCQQAGGRLPYIADTRLSCEIGVNLGEVRRDTLASPVSCRLGLFADYGLYWPSWLQLMSRGPVFDGYTSPVTDMSSSPYNFRSWPMTHVLNSNTANGQIVNNFLIGLKFTLICSFEKKQVSSHVTRTNDYGGE